MRLHALAALCALLFAGALPGAAAFEIKPTGRLHADYAKHDADVTPLRDRGELRRAQLGVEGTFTPSWAYEAVYDFVDDGEWKDVWVRYQGWDQGSITAGQFKVPFSLEELTSSNNITFIERALPVNAFGLSRRVGIGLNRATKQYSFALMGFGDAIDGDKGRGAGARFTFAPVDGKGRLVHFGLSAVTEEPEERPNLRTYPESRPTDERLVRTGNLADVDRINRIGLEGAWTAGPFSAQAEWMRASLQRGDGRADASLDGWYVGGSWLLTGESRGYKDGRMRGFTVARPAGAWELAARYSRVDLDGDGVRGGRERNVTVGVNWYAKDYVRIMANYIRVKSERRGVADNPSIFLVRAQAAF